MQTIITSATNPHVKYLKKLRTSSRARRESNLAIAEGIHLVQSFLQTGTVPREYICAASALQHKEVAALIEQLTVLSVRGTIVSDELFSSLSSVHASVGIMICLELSKPEHLPGKCTESAVVLEEVQDPGNIGAMLRVIAAVGVKDVFLSEDCASVWSPKALRAGMGAQFSLNIYEDVNLPQLLERSAIPALVTTLSGDSESLYSLDLTRPVLWVFGNEGQGVSRRLCDLATTHVGIPQASNAVESLNVATAVAVCLYEQFRQNT